MKRFLLFAAVSILFVSCAKEAINVEDGSQICTLEAFISEEGSTKVTVNDNGTSINHYWEDKDAISLFDGSTNVKFDLSVGAGSDKGTFTSSTSLSGTTPYYATYPYNSTASIDEGAITTTFKSTQTYKGGSYDKDALVMVASTSNVANPIPFKVANSFIQITLTPTTAYTVKTVEVTANGGEIIAGIGTISNIDGTPTVNMDADGSSTVTVSFGAGHEIAPGTPCTFFVALPAVTLSNGVSVAITGSDNKMILKKSSTLSLARNTVTNMPALDGTPTITNLALANSAKVSLSTPQTANCYVVNAAGTYAIPIDVTGNGVVPTGMTATTSLKGITSASIVWEDPETGGDDIITATPKVYGKYMTFNATAKKGNALLAAKVDTNIVWSWHIWCTDYVLGTNDHKFGKFTIMDKMLGASSSQMIGLMYRGGDKNPYRRMNYSTGYELNKDLEWLTKHPDRPTKSTASDNNAPFTDFNGNLWSTTKTMYDPSPVGYLVASDSAEIRMINYTAEGDTLYRDTHWKLKDDNGVYYELPRCGLFLHSTNYVNPSKPTEIDAFFVSSSLYWLAKRSMWCCYRISVFQGTNGGQLTRTGVNWPDANHGGNCICMRDK